MLEDFAGVRNHACARAVCNTGLHGSSKSQLKDFVTRVRVTMDIYRSLAHACVSVCAHACDSRLYGAQIAERREESRMRAARLMLAGQPPPADDPFDGLTPQVIATFCSASHEVWCGLLNVGQLAHQSILEMPKPLCSDPHGISYHLMSPLVTITSFWPRLA